jgi:hypothetical protein
MAAVQPGWLELVFMPPSHRHVVVAEAQSAIS